MCVLVHRGASGFCLPDIGGPCNPTMLGDKDCCLRSHKSSLFLFHFVSPLCPPPFLTLPMLLGEWSQGAIAGVRADTSLCPWPLASSQTTHYGEWTSLIME